MKPSGSPVERVQLPGDCVERETRTHLAVMHSKKLADHDFKKTNDEETRRALFPSNFPHAA